MTIYRLLPQPQAYGYDVGILLLNLVETHIPGDTAHARSYDFPVLFKVVEAMDVTKVTHGDRAIEPAIIEAAKELEQAGVKAISSNCGFMLHYQDAVRSQVKVPVLLSSLLQLPWIARTIGPDQKIAILTAWKQRLTPEVLKLSGLPDNVETVIASIEETPEFLNMAEEDLDSDAFGARLEEAAQGLFAAHDNIGALLLECAVYTPYAARLQRILGVPVYDFISMINYARFSTMR